MFYYPESLRENSTKATLDRFYVMWEYYLQLFIGTFDARLNQLWQIVYRKEGAPGVYDSVR